MRDEKARTERYPYSYGYLNRERAELAALDFIAAGEVSEAERPQVAPYTNRKGARRYQITLERSY